MTYYNLFIFLILVIAVLLILVIMVQNPKGGGLDSSFGGGGGSQLGGVQSTNKFLDRTTWTLAISLFGLIVMSNFVAHTGNVSNESTIKIENLATPKAEAEKTPATEIPAKTEDTEDTENK